MAELPDARPDDQPGRRGKHGVEYWAFVVLGQPDCALPVRRLAQEYRARFGIATSYRLQHQVRAATTSREPGLRLLLMTVGWLLSNLWVWIKARVIAQTLRPHRAASRRWLEARFRLDAFRDLLIEAIKALYHVGSHLPYPFPLASPLKL